MALSGESLSAASTAGPGSSLVSQFVANSPALMGVRANLTNISASATVSAFLSASEF